MLLLQGQADVKARDSRTVHELHFEETLDVFQAKVGVQGSLFQALQCDGSVGWGNHPDEDGEVTLDAMIMG